MWRLQSTFNRCFMLMTEYDFLMNFISCIFIDCNTKLFNATFLSDYLCNISWSSQITISKSKFENCYSNDFSVLTIFTPNDETCHHQKLCYITSSNQITMSKSTYVDIHFINVSVLIIFTPIEYEFTKHQMT